jgi:hypothetical protein
MTAWPGMPLPSYKKDHNHGFHPQGHYARIVTFANGTVARELLVDCDDARRRLVYAVIS